MFKMKQKICAISLCLAVISGILPGNLSFKQVKAAEGDIVINQCELANLNAGGWKFNGAFGIDTVNYRKGFSSFFVSTNPVDNQAVMRRNEVTAPMGLNLGVTTKKELQFWLKITDITNIAEMQVELGTTIDTNEFNWSLAYMASNGYIKQNEWIQVKLPISSAATIGAPDTGNINCFGIYFVTTAGNTLTFNVDDIKIVESTDVILNACEAADITSGYLALNNPAGANGGNPHCVADKKEGSSSIILASSTAGNPAYMRRSTSAPGINIGEFAHKKALQFWIKFNDINNISFLKIELGVAYDTAEYQWFLQSMSAKGFLVSGQWVKVTLPIAEANWVGSVNPADIKNFGILAYPKEGTTIQFNIDDVRVVNLPVNASGMINSCDEVNGSNWFIQSVSPSIQDTTDKKEGTGSFKFNFISAGTYVFQTNTYRINLFDLGDVTQKVVEMWFYINDSTKLDYLALELGSAGANDVNEYQWTIVNTALTNGWNKLRYIFDSASITGIPDPSSINWIRIFYKLNGGSEANQTIVGFDGLQVVQKSILPLANSGLSVNRTKGMLTGLVAGVSGSALQAQVDSFGATLQTVNSSLQTITTEKAGTGSRVLLLNAQQAVIDSLDIIVYGDVSGDGNIDVTDLSAMKLHLLKTTPLAGLYKTAGDVYKQGSLSINDLLAIKKHILGQQTIAQN